MRAVGCHVFAGGFTMGVRKVIPVTGHLEVHDLGRRTVEEVLRLPVAREDDFRAWKDHLELWDGVDLIFGNPRCTGFSCITCGMNEHDSHGPFAKQTRDAVELVTFGAERFIPFVIWESVQQAYTTGKPLLDWMRDTILAPRGYKIAHVFVNAAAFGNAQHRRRYFHVAYADGLTFNLEEPNSVLEHTTLGDVIVNDALMEREWDEAPLYSAKCEAYGPDTCLLITDEEKALVPFMPQGYDLNKWAPANEDILERAPELFEMWETRVSEIPFGMHWTTRMHENRACPVIFSSSGRYIHPRLDRPLTVHECALLMGWDVDPVGPLPIHQIGKGIVPDVGEWLAEFVVASKNGEWADDFEYVNGEYVDCEKDQREKVFDFTKVAPKRPRVILSGARI